MAQFKIREDGFRKLRKRWLTIMIPLMIAIFLIILLANIFSTKTAEVNTWPYVIPIVAAFLCFSLYRSLRKQKKVLLSYSVTISEEGITREQLNVPPLSISFMEIREIIKTEKGGFMIKGVHRTDIIYIPYLIDNPGALEERLQALAPITFGAKDPFYKKYGVLLFILAFGMLVAVYTVTNKIIVGICSPLLVGLFIWTFYQIRMNKNLPPSLKRISWFLLLLIVLIIFTTYAKLTGTWK